MKSCGKRFHDEVGKFRFLNELIKVVSPKYLGSRTSEKVKSKILELLYSWTVCLPEEVKIAEAYQMLKKQGIVKSDPKLPEDAIFPLPPPRPKNVIFEDEEKSKMLARLLKSSHPEDLRAANKLIKEMVQEDQKRMEKISKRVNAIEEVNNNVKLLTEMVMSHSQGAASSSSEDLMKELYQRCERMRPTLFRLASDTEDNDEALAEILQANDNLTQVINLYKQLVRGEEVNGDATASSIPGSTSALLDLSGPKKTRKEDSIRLRVLNGLLYKSLTELLCTPQVSQEVYDLNVELSKVSVTSDFSACRVYWKTGVSAEQNKHTESVLQRSAAYMRHLLISQQTLRNVPPIVFVQDKRDLVLAEVDRLLAEADFGPPDERDDLDGLRNADAQVPHDSPEPAAHPNLCGIDHEALNKQIMEYKRKKERGLQCQSLAPPSGREQAPEPTRLLRKREKVRSRWQHRDASPRSFLLGEEDEDEDSSTEWECHAHEAEDDDDHQEEELGADRGAQRGLCGKREQG